MNSHYILYLSCVLPLLFSASCNPVHGVKNDNLKDTKQPSVIESLPSADKLPDSKSGKTPVRMPVENQKPKIDADGCLIFADPIVKAFALNTWDVSRDQCIDRSEADRVTEIPDGAFAIPESESLYDHPEKALKTLDDLNSFQNLKIIGRRAFFRQRDLKAVRLTGITEIRDSAFAKSGLTEVTMPALERFADNSFEKCGYLKKIDFSKVKTIPDRAFRGDSFKHGALNTVILPNVEKIGDRAFAYNSIETLSLPKAVEIGNGAFKGSTELKTVDLPLAAHIGDYAFSYCRELTELNLPRAVSLGKYIFEYSVFTFASLRLTAKQPITTHAETFKNSSEMTETRKDLIINSYFMTNMRRNAFNSRSTALYLDHANFPNILESGSSRRHWKDTEWAVIKVTGDDNKPDESKQCIDFVDDSVKEYAMFAWDIDNSGCISPEEAAAAVTGLSDDNIRSAYNRWNYNRWNDYKRVHRYPKSLDDLKHFPNLKKIGRNLINGSEYLTSVRLSGIEIIDDKTFSSCKNLKDVYLPDAVEIRDSAFAGCPSLETLNIPKAERLGSNLIYGCSSLKNIALTSDRLIKYNNPPFYTELIFPDLKIQNPDNSDAENKPVFINGLDSYSWYNNQHGQFSFSVDIQENMAPLPELVSPLTLTVHKNNFLDAENWGGSQWKSVKTTGTESQMPEQKSCLKFIDPEVRRLAMKEWDVNGDKCISDAEAARVEGIPDAAFVKWDKNGNVISNNDLKRLDDLKQFPNLRTIGASAFYKCTALKNADLPNITHISESFFAPSAPKPKKRITESLGFNHVLGNGAFGGCIHLETVNLPNLEFLPKAAFARCSALKTVNLPKIKSIGAFAFMECTSLTDQNWFENVENIEMYAFLGCKSLKNPNFSHVTDASYGAFKGCSSLASPKFDALTMIHPEMFSGCSSLRTSHWPSVHTIRAEAFVNCTSLKNIVFEKAEILDTDVFSGCRKLKTIEFVKPNVSQGYDDMTYEHELSNATLTLHKDKNDEDDSNVWGEYKFKKIIYAGKPK